MPHKTFPNGAEVLAADFNPYVADQIVATYPNAAARASDWPTPPKGAVSMLLDSLGLFVYTGTQWVPPWNTAWGVLLNLKATANQAVNALTDLTGLVGNVTLVAGRQIRVRAHVQSYSTTQACVPTVYVCQDAIPIQQFADTTEAGGHPTTLVPDIVITSTAGAHAYKAQLLTGSATGTTIATAQYPATLTVEDVGPAGPPA